MAISVTVTFTPTQGNRQQLLDILQQSIANGPPHPDCLSADLIPECIDSEKIIIREKWLSREAHEAFFNELTSNDALRGIKHLFSDLHYTYSDK